MKWLIRMFGLKGSLSWAIRQMKKGHIVENDGWKFRSNNGRIEGDTFDNQHQIWDRSNIYIDDLESTDWEIYQKIYNR